MNSRLILSSAFSRAPVRFDSCWKLIMKQSASRKKLFSLSLPLSRAFHSFQRQIDSPAGILLILVSVPWEAYYLIFERSRESFAGRPRYPFQKIKLNRNETGNESSNLTLFVR